MATLYTNSASLKKGTDYVGVAEYGNAFQLTDETRVSINKSPFAKFPKYQTIFINPEYTYTFEEDTVVLIAHEIVPDYGVITNDYNATDIPLTADTESGIICSLADRGGKEVTRGTLTSFVYITSTSNQGQTVVIRFTGSTLGLISTSNAIDIPSNSDGTRCIHSIDLSAQNLPASEVVSFTVEGTNSDLAINGTNVPSQLQLTRLNL